MFELGLDVLEWGFFIAIGFGIGWLLALTPLFKYFNLGRWVEYRVYLSYLKEYETKLDTSVTILNLEQFQKQFIKIVSKYEAIVIYPEYTRTLGVSSMFIPRPITEADRDAELHILGYDLYIHAGVIYLDNTFIKLKYCDYIKVFSWLKSWINAEQNFEKLNLGQSNSSHWIRYISRRLKTYKKKYK